MGATIEIEGNVGRDMERKHIGDSRVNEFSVAVTNKVKGEKVTTWFRCSDWRGVTEDVGVTKGQRVRVKGRFFARPYQSNGADRISLDVNVDEISLVEWEEKGEQAEPAPRARKAPKAEPAPPIDDDSIPF